MGSTKTKEITAEPIESQEATATEQKQTSQKKARVRGKKYKDSLAKVDKTKLYTPEDAIALVKETSTAKFNASVELHVQVKKEGLSVNVSLPHSAGSSKVVEVANEKTIEKLKNNTIDFDILLSTAEMMPKLVPFARILGPRGMMPNPKNGTLIKTEADAKNFSVDDLTLKTERKAPLIHTVIGKVDMKDKDLLENLEAIINAVNKRQVVKAYLTSTMGPSVKLLVE